MRPMLSLSLNNISFFLVFPFGKGHGFVVRCYICSIMCEAWASRFFPCHDKLVLQKSLVCKGIYWCIMKQACCIPVPNHFFQSLHPTRAQNISFMCLSNLLSTSHAILGSWGAFFNLKYIFNNSFPSHYENRKWSYLKKSRGIWVFVS